MSRIFLIGILLGAAAGLGAAHFYPWVQHPRLASKTTVVTNGGRAERFVIRLPVDRITSVGSAEAGLRAVGYPPDVELPPEFDAQPVLLEHFKLRDADGNVIGVAARHWTATPEGTSTAWMLVIPSRGTLTMTGAGEAAGSIEAALRNGGYVAGTAWNGNLALETIADRNATQTISGSREFAGLNVQFTEAWSISGVGDAGEIRGTIELSTIGRRGS